MFESLVAELGVRTGRRPGTAGVAAFGGDAAGGNTEVSGNGACAGDPDCGTNGAEKKIKVLSQIIITF